MGILSAVTKVAKSVVKAVKPKTVSSVTKTVSSSAGSIFGKAKRVVKAAPDFIFGTGSDVGAKAMKATKGGFFTKLKAGAKAIVKDSEKAAAKGGGFFKRLFGGLKSTPAAIKNGAKVGSRAAKIAGKSSFWGATKGVFKAIGKRMPLIGSALCVAFEIPNIWSAAKDEGIGTALKETGKAVARLAGGAAGAMIGTFAGGPIGGIAGFAAGEWLVGKLTGDSYSDKKDYLAEQGIDDDTVKALKAQGYTFDQIYDEVKKAEKAAEEQGEQPVQQPAQQPVEQPAQQQPVVEQPTQPVGQQPVEQPVQQPVVQQPITQQPPVTDPAVSGTPVQYSAEDVAALKQMGLTDSDIQLLQSAGYSVNDVAALVNNIKNAGATTGVTPTTGTNPVAGAGNTDYLEPFVLPYPTTGSPYQQPGFYNPTVYSNPYAMDTYYNFLLNDLNQMQYQNNMTNPFNTGYNNYQPISQNQNQYDNMYYKNGQFRFSA